MVNYLELDCEELDRQVKEKQLRIGGTIFRVANDDKEKFWYLCTPYTKFPLGYEEAYEHACEMLAFLKLNNIFTYCPIAENHGTIEYLPKELITDHSFWLRDDFKFVRMSRGLIVCKLTGWEDSFGIGEEIRLAKSLGLPVIYTNFLELPKFEGK